MPTSHNARVGWRAPIMFADRLRATRRTYAKSLGRRVTGAELAELTGVGDKAYGAYEAGINEPRPDDLWAFCLRVAAVTGVDPTWLAGQSRPET